MFHVGLFYLFEMPKAADPWAFESYQNTIHQYSAKLRVSDTAYLTQNHMILSQNILSSLMGSILLVLPSACLAGTGVVILPLNLTQTWAGFFSLIIIALAYTLAILEDVTFLRKSKPMLLGATLIWLAILIFYRQQGDTALAVQAFKENLTAYMELLLFIMVSMAYLNAMEDMQIFNGLRVRLVNLNLGYRPLFWITGTLVFFISSVINGLTSSLLMGAVVVAVGKDNPRFVSLACLNIVIACNAGGTFSPLGGISTLFVWQEGVLKFTDFFTLFLPCLVNFLVPATLMHFAVPEGKPTLSAQSVRMHRGARRIMLFFGLTITLAVVFNMVLELPPAAGMMAGLALLELLSFYLMKTENRARLKSAIYPLEPKLIDETEGSGPSQWARSYAVFDQIGRLEWDSLLFFYGAMVGVGGLGFIGYLDLVSNWLYGQHSASVANILIGLSSAFIDNGTLMFAVLNMHPDLPQGEWLLVTLTLGVGGSLLAIGSAPGIGLLGLGKGHYSFGSHMKWCPVILLGYFAAIGTHFLINSRFF